MFSFEIDPSLEDEKDCSLSQASTQLQSTEEWPSVGGDNHSPCQDALPPPSSLPSCSPSPSPTSKREKALHSSLTLQSGEPCTAPLHHSLSISHGTPPLLLSHHISVGHTTVAIDVQFHPADAASTAAGASININPASSSTLVSAPLEHGERSTARCHHSK